ncbi:hypothetical protein J8F10_37330 [Gemmata sp. G18]|uniref:DUF4412 domain-containing protein n=1 Tax=Gemmata palustris TaxID=2822762 RepID=A0ABS5C4Q0_9BACT|nr:DUF6263 family protein [Gemmata palustris]MBP3960919.1 hypothetical protein [Gemmata palustris]
MLRTRFAVAALLGVAVAALAGAQDRKFDLNFGTKDKDGKYTPYYQEVTTEVTQVIKVQGQDLTQKQKSVFWYQWTPIKEDKVKEGAEDVTKWTVKQKIEGLEMNIDISGNPINYSSKTETPGSAGNPGLVEFFKGLKDSEFTVTLGKNYKVEKVEGKEDFIKKLGAGSAQMDALLKKVMTDDALKEMVDPTSKLFPDGPKKVGESWEKKTSLNLGPIGSYELLYKLKYAAVEKEKDKIEVETAITYTAPKENPEGLLFRIKEGSKLTSDPAKSKGTVIYDPKTKRIESAEINITLKGDLIVVIGGTDTRVELTQEQKTIIKTQDKSYLEKAPAPVTPPVPGK